MLLEIVDIAAGFVLGASALADVPNVGKELVKVSKTLSGFQFSIGVLAFVLGILNLGSLEGIVGILAGFVLIGSSLQLVPKIGDELAKIAKTLSAFQTAIGIAAIVIGVWKLLF